jgi:cytochrome b
VRVWDPVVRVLHWSLAASIAAAWLTRHGGGQWHERIGYATLAIVALRVLWGWVGPRYARFGQFVRPPRATWRYGLAMLAHREPRHVGHNPLGGWMIVALLLTAALAAGTGWLYTTDEFWGIAWVEQLHEALAIFILVLAALHVLGVIAASIRHKENLAGAMVHGRKRAPAQGDVE